MHEWALSPIVHVDVDVHVDIDNYTCSFVCLSCTCECFYQVCMFSLHCRTWMTLKFSRSLAREHLARWYCAKTNPHQKYSL